MDSDELIGIGHTPDWVKQQAARMQGAADQQRVLDSRAAAALFDAATVPLSELGMYGTSLDGVYSWCLCSLCQRPVGGPAPGYTRAEANVDIRDHLRIAHGAKS